MSRPRPIRTRRSRATRSLFLAVAVAGTGFACGGDVPNREPDAPRATSDVPTSRPSSEALPERFAVGRPATVAEIAALDIDVMPDGTGLPPGSGTVDAGAEVYARSCASCHGRDLQGTPAGTRLAPDPDRPGFPDGETPGARAIGNYWPYATTIFDYTRRSMPYDRPGSLGDDEVYAVTAYLLWRNGIIDRDEIMDRTTLPAVRMPARDRFVADDRLESDRVR